jgi:hypothetical protein
MTNLHDHPAPARVDHRQLVLIEVINLIELTVVIVVIGYRWTAFQIEDALGMHRGPLKVLEGCTVHPARNAVEDRKALRSADRIPCS